MATAHISVKIGSSLAGNQASPSQLSLISAKAELHKGQIEKHYSELSQKLKKYRLPFITIDLPQKIKTVPIPLLEEYQEDIIHETHSQNGRFYHMIDMRHPQMQMILKKVEKTFEKLTELNNTLYVNCRLYESESFLPLIKEKKLDFLSIMLQHAEIDANLDLDQQFVKILGNLLSKISPGFDQSPIIGFLELFSELQLEATLQSPATLKPETRQKYLNPFCGFQFPDDDEKGILLKSLLDSRDIVNVYIDFKKLGFLHFSFEARIYAYILCLNL